MHKDLLLTGDILYEKSLLEIIDQVRKVSGTYQALLLCFEGRAAS